MLIDSILLLILFLLLGWAADLVVVNLRATGAKLGIKVFFLGLLLGLFTSAPETALGINSLINNIESVSVGNLLGGIMVIFGLVLGLSIILNRKIRTDGKITHIIPVFFYLFLTLVLGLDNVYSFIDGVLLILGYVGLVVLMYYTKGGHEMVILEKVEKKEILRHLFKIILGLIAVVVVSHYIIDVSVDLLTRLKLSQFFIGTMIFAIGTNLPEIIITLRSWRRHLSELSISHLIGSAIANPLVIGILASFKSLTIDSGQSFILLSVFLLMLFGLLAIFYKTDNRLSRVEGVVLLLVYLAFLFTEIYLVS